MKDTFYLDQVGLVVKPTKTNNNYWSSSKQEYLEVASMPEQHVRNAFQKILNDGPSQPTKVDDVALKDIKYIMADLQIRIERL